MRAMRILAATAVAGACTEPVIDMELQAPPSAESYDTSCMTAVEVRAIGREFATNKDDYTRSCLELPRSASTYAELRSMIHDRLTLDLPESGLGGVTVRGFAGPTACELSDARASDYRNDFQPNLVFYSKTGYIGQDTVELRAVPNLKCPTTNLKVRVVDMFALVASGSSASCATAMSYADKKGWSGVGTIVPKLFGKGVDYFGSVSWAQGTNSVVQFDGMIQLVQPGQQTCLALAGANENGAVTACVIGGASVCAGTGELEIAAVDYDVRPQVDRTLEGTFPSITFGSVWSNASPKTPIGGATVTVDPEHGKVVYIDPPDGSGIIHTRADQSRTGPSGLFILYADGIVSAKVDGAGKSRTAMFGTPDFTRGGVMVVLQ